VINGETIRLAQATGGVIIITGVALGLVERGERAPAPDADDDGETPATATARARTAAGSSPSDPETTVPATECAIDAAR